MTRHAVTNRMDYDGWQAVLPNVYLTHAGEPTKRQMLVAALLWAGPEAAIDGRDACRFHGIKAAPPGDDRVELVAPSQTGIRSTGFVVVRRTMNPIYMVRTRRLRYVDAATAVVAAARRMHSDMPVIAAFSDALQRGTCTEQELLRAHVQGPGRNAARAERALAALRTGARSVPEVTFAQLASASAALPPLLYNPLLRLPDGRIISPDALAPEAALVHETNGRSAHAREDLFESMQERHGVMTVAGLTVLHSTPRQLWTQGRRIITSFESCYIRDRGKGLSAGVTLLSPLPSAAVAG